MKWIIILLVTAAAIASAIFIGLRSVSRTVIVTDPFGKPIAGAEVSGETASYGGQWIPTNAKGRARLMDSPQEIYTDAPAKWPFRVMLTTSKPIINPKGKATKAIGFQ